MTAEATAVRRLYVAAILTPLLTIRESPLEVKMAALGVGIVQFILHIELFLLVWALLAAVTLFDYVIGSARARMAGTWCEDISRAKLLGKVLGLGIVWMVFAAEVLVGRALDASTSGAVAITITALLVLDEARSLNRHKKDLTGRAVPGLGTLIDWMDGVLARRLPSAPKAEP